MSDATVFHVHAHKTALKNHLQAHVSSEGAMLNVPIPEKGTCCTLSSRLERCKVVAVQCKPRFEARKEPGNWIEICPRIEEGPNDAGVHRRPGHLGSCVSAPWKSQPEMTMRPLRMQEASLIGILSSPYPSTQGKELRRSGDLERVPPCTTQWYTKVRRDCSLLLKGSQARIS